ncbi:hypothetical protein EXS74_02300 [Candidatus Woesearchaeota archaeon]|nr:hypothetical protein [Candidatus Woesearchaeota archaeon]
MKFHSLFGLIGLYGCSPAFALTPAQQLTVDNQAIARYLVDHVPSPLEIFGDSMQVPDQHCYPSLKFSVGTQAVGLMFCNESAFPVSPEHPLKFTPKDYLTMSIEEEGNPRSIVCLDRGIDGFHITPKNSPSDLLKTPDRTRLSWIESWGSSWNQQKLEHAVSLCAPFSASIQQELSRR